MGLARAEEAPRGPVCIATSIHPDYDGRVFRHAQAVAAMGYDVDLVCPWKPRSSSLPARLRIIPFERVGSRGLRRGFLVPQRMLPLLLARRYALYHFHDLDILPLFALLKLVTRTPVIYDCHENYAAEMLYRDYSIPDWTRPYLASAVLWGERFAALVVRDVVTVVDGQATTFPAPWFRTTLVQNFAELGLETGRDPEYLTRADACISIASQYVDNGALFFGEVAVEVNRRRPNVKFYTVDRFGSATLRSTVLHSGARLGSRFEMLPNVLPVDIMRNLNRATIGLALDLDVPHRRAALPTKLFEYMAAGLPVVAADLPNTRAVIEAAGCGILARPGDAQSFAEAICRLVDDRETARAFGERGLKAYRERFNWESEVRKLGPVYARLIAQRGVET